VTEGNRMYEKPQYLTRDGYKRLDKNPHRDDAPVFKLVPKKKAIQSVAVQRKGIKLSDKAAKMIATVLKDMLKEQK
jgi:hypothetical protein